MGRLDVKKIENEFMREGYFSEYLPPPFCLPSDEIDVFDLAINEKNDYIEPLSFNMSRFTEDGKRRIIFIPELTSYIIVAKYMKNEDIIQELINISTSSKNSFSHIIQPSGELTRHERDYARLQISSVTIDENAVNSTYIPNIVKKIILSKGAKGILFLDISNYYSSIYTHLIPAIKLGYENAEEQYKLFMADRQNPNITEDYRKYFQLDKYIRNMNKGRTNGILPGILSSQFLAEALLSIIDLEFVAEGIKFVRYVDDYEVFIYDENELAYTQNIMEKVIHKYSLSFNKEKTKYTRFPYYLAYNLEKIYQGYLGEKVENDELMKLFNTYFDMEQKGIKGAIRFLIKCFDNKFKPKNYILFTAYLINALVNDSRSLVKTCELIISEKDQLHFNEKDKEIIEKLLEQNVSQNNHHEVIWLIYLLKHIGLKRIKAHIIYKIINSGNELALIILLEEYNIKLTTKMIREIILQAKSWLLLYQLFLHDYIEKDDFARKSKIKHNLPFYISLKKNNFSFYSPQYLTNPQLCRGEEETIVHIQTKPIS